MTDTPITDAEESRQRELYEKWAKPEWPAFAVDFAFARKMEIALQIIAEQIAKVRNQEAK